LKTVVILGEAEKQVNRKMNVVFIIRRNQGTTMGMRIGPYYPSDTKSPPSKLGRLFLCGPLSRQSYAFVSDEV
jgi:hypothetical protein